SISDEVTNSPAKNGIWRPASIISGRGITETPDRRWRQSSGHSRKHVDADAHKPSAEESNSSSILRRHSVNRGQTGKPGTVNRGQTERFLIFLAAVARLARVVAVDVAHHVTQRGNARQFILSSDAERMVYLDLLRQAVRLHALSMIGYCLMSNHVHLVVMGRRLSVAGRTR